MWVIPIRDETFIHGRHDVGEELDSDVMEKCLVDALEVNNAGIDDERSFPCCTFLSTSTTRGNRRGDTT